MGGSVNAFGPSPCPCPFGKTTVCSSGSVVNGMSSGLCFLTRPFPAVIVLLGISDSINFGAFWSCLALLVVDFTRSTFISHFGKACFGFDRYLAGLQTRRRMMLSLSDHATFSCPLRGFVYRNETLYAQVATTSHGPVNICILLDESRLLFASHHSLNSFSATNRVSLSDSSH